MLRRMVLVAALCSTAVQAAPPSPETFLGHRVGADRKLADWGQIVRYFEVLDRESDRVELQRLGESTLGRPFIMAVVSSEDNLRDLETHRATAKQLAGETDLDSADAETLVRRGKVILLVTCNIHSSEIASSQMAMEWAFDLATTVDPRVRAWLDDVILLLLPSINPDGTDMIVDYYRKYVGTEWEGGRLPWLYHHYAGHDNNRDWYMLNLIETRHVTRVLHHEWFPQVFLDEHQMGSTAPRMFVPPYADPHTPLAHPLQWRLNSLVGTLMALRLEAAGKSGVIQSYAFDAYWPGGTKNTAALKNVVGLLTEVASARIATPVYVDPAELAGGRKGLPEYKAQMNFPNPWPGGWWRLRDIVDYELVASNSLLETCSTYRADILRSAHEMARDAVRRGMSEAPYAYVVAPDQADPVAAAALVDILRLNGLEAHRSRDGFETDDGRMFAENSIVFLAAQPYRGFLVEMMERQRYPEVRQGPDTREIFRPYDVTAWTLPLLMGVEWARVDTAFEADLVRLDATPWPEGGLEGTGGAGFAVDCSANAASRLANLLLAQGVPVERATEPFTADGRLFAPGSFLIPANAASKLEAAARQTHIEAVRIESYPNARRRMRSPRVGVYKPWVASMDEGWTRYVLDTHDFTYVNLDNAAVQAKNLRSKFDAILLPDVERQILVEGKPKGDGYFEPLPPPYAGGIGKEGVARLREFVEAGGTLVCLSSSCGLPLEDFNLPVRDVVAKNSDFSLPGTLVHLNVDPSHPLGYGMPETCAAYCTGGPVFGTSIPGANVARNVVARYAAATEDLIASGWADDLEPMAGRAAVVEARLGKGRVVLFGPRVQHRAQTLATYKLLFNALYLSSTD